MNKYINIFFLTGKSSEGKMGDFASYYKELLQRGSNYY